VNLMRQPLHRSQRRALLRALAIAPLVGVSACDPSKPQFVSIDITGADYARSFRLPDQHGQVRTLDDFKGQVVAVFFGYTQCPDVCPTTLTEWVEITPEVLKAYMGNFDPSFLALIPENAEALAQVAKEFKIIYKKVDGKTPGSYTMDHSAGSYLYDPQGRLRLYSRYGNKVDGLVADIRLLLK
jgi:protein SCO1/2